MTDELLIWFYHNKRPLPWRENPEPYYILVSEIMAQQTRMAQLLPFYTRFVAQFPTPEALASATEDEVLTAWAGMGYYARARNLHRAIKEIRASYGNNWPTNRKEWEALPGIGPYTAGAVLSIAFGQKEAAIDGNILRVYARVNNDKTDISTPAAKSRATAFVLKNMPDKPDKIRLFNQSLMELGALVCTPQNPKCENCPIAQHCQARQVGTTHNLPVKAKKNPSPEIPVGVILILSPEGKVLMRRRTEGLLKGMWVYYLTEGNDGTTTTATAIINHMGYTLKQIQPAGTATHTFTHRIWHMTAHIAHINETHAIEDYQFLSPDDLTKIAITAAMGYFSLP